MFHEVNYSFIYYMVMLCSVLLTLQILIVYYFNFQTCFLTYLTYNYPSWSQNYTSGRVIVFSLFLYSWLWFLTKYYLYDISVGYLFRNQYWIIVLLLEKAMTTLPGRSPGPELDWEGACSLSFGFYALHNSKSPKFSLDYY